MASKNNDSKRRTNYQSVSHSTNRSRRRKRINDTLYLIVGAAVIAVLIVILIIVKVSGRDQGSEVLPESTEAELISSEVIRFNAAVDLSEILPSGTDNIIYIEGMTPSEISSAIIGKYNWSLAIVNEDAEVGAEVIQTVDASATTEAATMGSEDNPDGINSYESETEEQLIVSERIEVPDLILAAIPDFVNGISLDNEAKVAELNTPSTPDESSEETKKSLFGRQTAEETEEITETEEAVIYTFSLGDISPKVEEIAAKAQTLWYVEPTGGSIGSYDSSTDSFVMETAKKGFAVDKDKLISLITDSIEQKEYEAEIPVPGNTLSAESNITVGDYQIIGTYTTNTTSNSVRNKNIRLACEAVNGTIVRPGEEFSFNNTVGQRTEAKGYGEAAAYNNGEVVQEIGGGVCQVSTTLYNAVVKAGLKVTSRQSHTFQPTYVTPGLDATISWGGPDFKFANLAANSEYSYSENYAIGIKASYYNQTVTVSIYGRPVLKSGYTYSLSSEKTKEIDMVRVLITPDSDKQPATGSKGSVWETRLVVKKDGEVVSNNVDHMAYYTGHTEYYYEVVETEPESVPESESESETDGGEIISDVPLGPGGGSSSAPGVIYQPGSVIIPATQSTEPQTEAGTEAGTEAPEPAAETGSEVSDGPGAVAVPDGSGNYISSEGPGSLPS